jgi:sec-independent protein translocase protein TatB
MDLFGINFPELTVIMLVALIIFGPDKLPEIMRTAGRYVAKIRSLGEEAKSEVSRELNLGEVSKIRQELSDTLKDTKKELQTTRDSLTSAATDIKSTIQQAREQYTYSSEDIDTMKGVNESAANPEVGSAIVQAAVNEDDRAATAAASFVNINLGLNDEPKPSAPVVSTPDTGEFSWQDALSNNAPPPRPKWRGEETLASPGNIIQDMPPAPVPSETEGAADGGQQRQGVNQ